MNWQTNKVFEQPFYVEGCWNLSSVSTFPKCEYLGADTETKLYLNDKLLSEDEVYNLYKNNGQDWIKKNVEVKCYAFMLSDGDNFVLFQTCHDFILACCMFRAKTIFWYNARFDFSIFDYYLLTNGWHDSTEEINKLNGRYGKLPSKTFQSLNGDYGQRYSMRLWYEYTNNTWHKKVHNFRMIDICNIFGGGLKANLESWKIKDHQGNDIRKLEMDYVSADIEEDIQYMINDTKGLYLLAEAIEKTLKEISGYSLFDGDYLTAGGLAKKTMLKHYFNRLDEKENIKAFKYCFPMTIEEDNYFRNNNLYLGGKCFVNPLFRGVVCNNVYTYDVNSMYPNQMRNMTYPVGKGIKVDSVDKYDKDHCYILCISNLYGCIKRNMVAVWQDKLSDEYVDIIREPDIRLIWKEELDEYERYYDLEYDINYVLIYQAKHMKGARTYTDLFYEIKKHNKGAMRQGAKLFLNSAYGKLAQRIERIICAYELNEDGVVHLVKKREEVDVKGMMSVVVGSRVTSLARCHLMRLIRESTNNDPKHKFIYCDTDSLKILNEFNDPEEIDDVELGKLKCEGVFEHGLFLAPKSYLLYNSDHCEVHCKGVNIKVVEKELKKCKDFSEMCDVFKPNRTFKCLCGMNVKGGKALIYVDKMILNDENLKINKEALNEQNQLDDVDYEDLDIGD